MTSPEGAPERDHGRSSGSGAHVSIVLWAAAAYLVAGVVFGWLAGLAASGAGVRAWRLAAWTVSALVFGAHILHELVRRRSSAVHTAWWAASAAALGAFGLAAASNVHALRVGEHAHQVLRLLSLVIWPVATLIPAFLAALVAAAVLNHLWGRERATTK